MAGTMPTKKPVPSKDVRDLGFNSEKVDEVVNSENNFYRDRFDNDRLTIKGLERSAVSAGPTVEAATNAVEQANEARRATEQLKSESSSFVQSAVDSAASAQKDAERAENAAANAEAKIDNDATFPSVESGLSQTQSGQYFRVPTDSDPIAFVYYKNNNGTAERVTDTPSGTALSNIQRTFTTTVNQDAVTFEDTHGRKAVAIKDDGTLQAGLVDCQGILTSSNDGWLVKLLVDQHGNVALGVDEHGVTHGFFQNHINIEEQIQASYSVAPKITVNPNQFEGDTQHERIMNACAFLKISGGGTLELGEDTVEPENSRKWVINHALPLHDYMTVSLDKSTLKLANGVFDNIIRPSNIKIDPENPNGVALEIGVTKSPRIIGNSKTECFIEGPDIPYTAPHPINGGNPIPWTGDFYGWRTVGVLLPNCKDYELTGFTMRKTTCWAISQERGCDGFKIHDLHFETNVKNGDGIDFRMGCKNGIVENISGNTSDDLIAMTALLNFISSYPSGNYIWPLQISGDAPSELGNDIESISFNNISGSSLHNLFRVLLAGGAKIKNISASGLSDTGAVNKNIVNVSTGYGSPSVIGDLSNISINQIESKNTQTPLYISAPIQDSTFNFIRQHKADGVTHAINSEYPIINTTITNAKKVN